MRKKQVVVIGSAGREEYPKNRKPKSSINKLAEKAGRVLAKRKAIVITGGKGGVMESVSRGAKAEGGTTVGIVCGNKRNTSNKYIDIEIVANTYPTGEESTLIASCDGVLAIGGGAGTLQELAIAYKMKKPIVAINTGYGYGSKYADRYLDERKLVKIKRTTNPNRAVDLLMKLIK